MISNIMDIINEVESVQSVKSLPEQTPIEKLKQLEFQLGVQLLDEKQKLTREYLQKLQEIDDLELQRFRRDLERQFTQKCERQILAEIQSKDDLSNFRQTINTEKVNKINEMRSKFEEQKQKVVLEIKAFQKELYLKLDSQSQTSILDQHQTVLSNTIINEKKENVLRNFQLLMSHKSNHSIIGFQIWVSECKEFFEQERFSGKFMQIFDRLESIKFSKFSIGEKEQLLRFLSQFVDHPRMMQWSDLPQCFLKHQTNSLSSTNIQRLNTTKQMVTNQRFRRILNDQSQSYANIKHNISLQKLQFGK